MKIPLFDLVNCLSDAIDLINPRIMSHHKRVAYIACHIAGYLGLADERREKLFVSSLLHDIGAIAATFEEKQELEQFEIVNPHKHAILGYQLLKSYQPFQEVAQIIKYHHTHWRDEKKSPHGNQDIPIESYIVHLADRVDILINRSKNVLDQTDTIRKKIQLSSGLVFNPEMVECFTRISEKESFWLDLTSPYLTDILKEKLHLPILEADMDHLREIARLFSHIIDFRSGFTASHSSGVASSAEQLAIMAGVDKTEAGFIGIAGYLHDIGKLAVPNEILNKPEELTAEEFNVVKRHTYHTYQILSKISLFKDISRWAANHHERLDGGGYPFRYEGKDLDIGSRILAVTDIFTALTEDRPYRRGMDSSQVKTMLRQLVTEGVIDEAVVSLLLREYEIINEVRREAQQSAEDLYRRFWEQANQMMVASQPV